MILDLTACFGAGVSTNNDVIGFATVLTADGIYIKN